MALSFITFLHILLAPFLLLCIWLYVLYASIKFVNYVILLLCLCILIVMYVPCILFHCVVPCIVFV